ncbi:hypothetical protein [Methanobrevibacter sp.]|uniref:hypothetical protein n=1 Tax=Methanobrevibacter sp. TaxID=66852 RepID=UPI00388EC8C7
MAKEELDIDKEIEKLSRKTNINMRKSENSFENMLKRLDEDIDKVMNKKIKEFDDSKKLSSKYLNIDYTQDSIKRYREKLNNI